MFLLDTNVVSETRKRERANEGVRAFFEYVETASAGVFVSVVTIGELRRGIEMLGHRGDVIQMNALQRWFDGLQQYSWEVLPVDTEISHRWGKLRAPRSEPALDKLIAATALVHELTVVTRNVADFAETGVDIVDPFN
jgi:predicted nucleic acid-binding protein